MNDSPNKLIEILVDKNACFLATLMESKTATVEDFSSSLFDYNIKPEQKTNYLGELSAITCEQIKLEEDNTTNPPILWLYGNNCKIPFSNRPPSQGELRGDRLKKLLTEAKNDPIQKKLYVYNYLSDQAPELSLHSGLFSFSPWLRQQLPLEYEDQEKKEELKEVFSIYIDNFLEALKKEIQPLLDTSATEEDLKSKILRSLEITELFKAFKVFADSLKTYDYHPEATLKRLQEILKAKPPSLDMTLVEYFNSYINIVNTTTCSPKLDKGITDSFRDALVIDNNKIIPEEENPDINDISSILKLYKAIEDIDLCIHFGLNGHQEGLYSGTLYIEYYLRQICMKGTNENNPRKEEYEKFLNFLRESDHAIYIDKQKDGSYLYRCVKSEDISKNLVYEINFHIEHDKKNNAIIHKNFNYKIGDSAKNLGLSEDLLNELVKGQQKTHPVAEANLYHINTKLNEKLPFNSRVIEAEEKLFFVFWNTERNFLKDFQSYHNLNGITFNTIETLREKIIVIDNNEKAKILLNAQLKFKEQFSGKPEIIQSRYNTLSKTSSSKLLTEINFIFFAFQEEINNFCTLSTCNSNTVILPVLINTLINDATNDIPVFDTLFTADNYLKHKIACDMLKALPFSDIERLMNTPHYQSNPKLCKKILKIVLDRPTEEFNKKCERENFSFIPSSNLITVLKKVIDKEPSPFQNLFNTTTSQIWKNAGKLSTLALALSTPNENKNNSLRKMGASLKPSISSLESSVEKNINFVAETNNNVTTMTEKNFGLCPTPADEDFYVGEYSKGMPVVEGNQIPKAEPHTTVQAMLSS